MAIPDHVREKLDTLPASPGVYVFRDAKTDVLYVGKARSLRSRVRSYFQPGGSDDRYFIVLLERELADIETYVVDTEKEAALLENQLIKELKPRYNVKLRDDKEFLSLRLDPAKAWPRLEVVRRPRQDGARYFGPYHSATAARQTLRLVNRHFQLRTCTDTEMRARVRPCLQYQIKRCPAPCVRDVDQAEYAEQARLVGLFLDGRHDEVVRDLEKRMKGSADGLDYERAAIYRDQLRAIERVREDQRVTVVKDVDQDVVGLYRQADQAQVAVLMIRGGKLVGVRTYDLKSTNLPDDELCASFLAEYYGEGAFVPEELVLPMEIEAMAGLEAVLGDRRGGRVHVHVPQRGPKKKLAQMAAQNAAHAFKEKAREREDVEERLAQVMRRLRLAKLPRRIECIDVSHIGGQDTVAVIVALENGAPDRKRYRSFVVRDAKAGDDYGAMLEVLSRRFARAKTGDARWSLPDLLLVDGGKGQLNVALTALRDLDITDLEVASLAKEKESLSGEKLVDRVYRPGAKNAVSLRDSSPALRMLALARDEAHRASNHLRETRGTKRRFASALEEVPGVGPKTRAKLLTAVGSLDAIKRATVDELVRAGATAKQAALIARTLGTERTLGTADTTELTGTAGSTSAPDDAATAEEAEQTAVDNAFVD